MKRYIIESGTGYYGDNYRVIRCEAGVYHGDWKSVGSFATYAEAVAAGDAL